MTTIPNYLQSHNTMLEAVFYFGSNHKKNNGSNHSLSLKADFLPDSMANFFEYQLRLQPENLSCHLQRIQFFLYKKQINLAFIAMCDLFIILGCSGQLLRQRLWKSAKNYLSREQANILGKALRNNSLDKNQSTLPNECLFKNKTPNLLDDLITSDTDNENPDNILLIADSFIENSQFEEAQKYLTEQLRLDPDNVALTTKLIHLYEALHLQNEFNQAYQEFADNLLTAQLWDEAKPVFN